MRLSCGKNAKKNNLVALCFKEINYDTNIVFFIKILLKYPHYLNDE